jgi:phosphatidylserine decarboxylase
MEDINTPHSSRTGLRRGLDALVQLEALNFVLTNRLPRALASRVAARISRSEQPLVRAIAMRIWTTFGGDLALHEARDTAFPSVHACFIRQLKEGARPIDADPEVMVSPCDGIVGACGAIDGTRVFQAKGFPYSLAEILLDRALAERHRGGCYVTLRLTSTMYHRFHAPDDCAVEHVTFVPGDRWNVNPAALRRVDRLFCRNERAVVALRASRRPAFVTLVPVAAILVGSLRVHCVDRVLDQTTVVQRRLSCRVLVRRGDEMGYFAHGSTIVVFGDRRLVLAAGIREGMTIRMGQPLLTYA